MDRLSWLVAYLWWLIYFIVPKLTTAVHMTLNGSLSSWQCLISAHSWGAVLVFGVLFPWMAYSFFKMTPSLLRKKNYKPTGACSGHLLANTNPLSTLFPWLSSTNQTLLFHTTQEIGGFLAATWIQEGILWDGSNMPILGNNTRGKLCTPLNQYSHLHYNSYQTPRPSYC